jgi:hypothetical protein
MNHIYEVTVTVRGNGYKAGYTKVVHVDADTAAQAKVFVQNSANEQKIELGRMTARKVF